MKKKKIFSTLAGVGVVLLLLGSCSKPQVDEPTPTVAADSTSNPPVRPPKN